MAVRIGHKKGEGLVSPNALQNDPDLKSLKYDFVLLDHYQAYSAELVRISLLAIGGFGAVFTAGDKFAVIGNLGVVAKIFAVLCSGLRDRRWNRASSPLQFHRRHGRVDTCTSKE